MNDLAVAVESMTPQSVQRWLEDCDGSDIKFVCDSCYDCLFAKYLGEQIHAVVDVGKKLAHFDGDCKDSDVTPTGYIHQSQEEIPLPQWARDVIERFDQGKRGQARGVKGTLRILREVCPELMGANL